MFFNRASDQILAVDLAPDAVRLIELRTRGGQPVVEQFAQQSLEEGPPATLPERHLATLGAMVSTCRWGRRQAVASLPTSMVLTRTVSPDKARPPAGVAPGTATVEDQILWTLANCLPFDPRELVFDYWPIGSDGRSGSGDVLVVATQSSVVEKYLKGFERLGLTCTHMDVAPCAIASLIAYAAENPEAPVGTIELSSNMGFFSISEHGRVLFWRPFELPGGAPTAGNMQTTLDRIGDEISKCVSHMVGSMQLDNLSEMLLFGQGAGEFVMSEYLKNRFHLPVRSPSPFDVLPPEAMPEELRTSVSAATATHFATATGLALLHKLAA